MKLLFLSIRSLRRYKLYSFINILGLALSLACTILIAFLIATPVSWLGLTKYLEDFAHKTTISWWLFAIALIITGGIALLTLIWQVRKAASANPADAVKTE